MFVSRGNTDGYAAVTFETTGVANSAGTPGWLAGLTGQIGIGSAHNYTVGEVTDGSMGTDGGGSTITPRMVVVPGGNVGIGTQTPVSILDINGAQTIREMASASAPTPAAGKTFLYADDTSHTLKLSLNGAAYGDLATTSGVSTNYVAKAGDTMTGPLVNNSNSASTALAVTQSGAGAAATFMGGNVGIGTATPTAILDASGTAASAVIRAYATTGVPSLRLESATSSPYLMFQSGPMIQDLSAGNLRVRAATGGFIEFDTDGGNERMRINAAGNVGIGTTGPSYKLDVAGTIRTTADSYVDGGLTVNGGQLTDNTGAVAAGIKMTPAKKCGLYVTDNFNAGCGPYGANLASVQNAAVNLTASSNNVVFDQGGIANTFNNQSGQFANVFVTQQVPSGALDTGNTFSQVLTNGLASTGTAYNYTSYNYMQSTGTQASLQNFVGFYSRGQFAVATPQLTNQYDFRADNFMQNTNGNITNRYGLYLGFNSTNVTNAWGVYQASSSVKNYYAGNVGIGTTTPSSILDINGAQTVREIASASAPTPAAGKAFLYADDTSHTLKLSLNGAAYGDLATTSGVSTNYVAKAGDTMTGPLVNNSNSASTALAVTQSGAGAAATFMGGNVGIGTTSPTAKLDIDQGNLTNSWGLRLTNVGPGTSGLQINQTAGGWLEMGNLFGDAFYLRSTNRSMRFEVLNNAYDASPQALLFTQDTPATRTLAVFKATAGQSADIMQFQDSSNAILGKITASGGAYFAGNVGIGTTAPTKLLHVVGDQSQGQVKFERTTATTTGTSGALQLEATTSGDMTWGFGPSLPFVIKDNAGVDNLIAQVAGVRAGADDSGELLFTTWQTGTANERMRITSAGLVGIGTASPLASLHVETTINGGGARAVHILGPASDNNWGGGIHLTSKDTTTTEADLIVSTNGLDLSNAKSTPIRFFTNSLERMQVDANGNLGIGNTSPAQLLHVGSAAVGTGLAVANFQNADGTCTITPASSGSGIACSSDERLKENFQEVTGAFALDRILQLQAVTYNFKTSSPDNRRTGYKAQDVQKVAPEFVRENQDGLLQVYYDAFIPWITEAMKTLYSRITGIEGQQRAQAEMIDAQARNIASVQAENAKLKANDLAKDEKIKELEQRLERIEKSLNSK